MESPISYIKCFPFFNFIVYEAKMKKKSDPVALFAELYEKILQSGALEEPSAMTLATATPDGKPSARVVLLKGYDEHGFVFYTNLESRKAAELKINPQAALCFYWEPIHYQVRIEGSVLQVPEEEADAYFATRPRGSQIGAWASSQSSQLKDRTELETRFRETEQKFEGETIPRPGFWSGFRLAPQRFEFWERRENRLHERFLYVRKNARWEMSLLYP
ncbi:pyridoxamine 5'-phosphate oxidase [candidate division KSB1 bacterium]|nr:pyridoxamine 5'-phosphate oxidase [candidate division KSB1 bacterium]NIR68761.1 pyridoxamine 5'-phosphate oxidase [candidate division KSB1 bacterium]NIS25577.1 pyridoxamine 5'-phosphate oxidase [candidate division KSB1 bacterium]NIT72471.1 pyridoxamine 5'-phosphate oxidase [candidate division KSB1 bacterium]NIU26255.1 pyridoxamine 5'-phosphate oxidase [candidate division KSB1 bacterium]